MTTYVLVGGAWLGSWCWQPVARRLRDNGHDAYPVTLTGLGERAHLAGPDVDLETHITDVVNLVEFEDLHDTVLLGHSYAGLVVTGAADRVPGRISQLIYLDTAPIPDGTALIEMFPPEARKHIERQVEDLGDGWRFAMPPPEELATMGSLEGLDEDLLKLLRSRAVPQPFATYTTPLRLENPARDELSKVGILCSFSLDQVQELIVSDDPIYPQTRRPDLAVRRATNGTLANVLETGRPGRSAPRPANSVARNAASEIQSDHREYRARVNAEGKAEPTVPDGTALARVDSRFRGNEAGRNVCASTVRARSRSNELSAADS